MASIDVSDKRIDSRSVLRLPRSRAIHQVLHSMLVIREFEEKVSELRRKEDIRGSVHLCVGQESVPVAVLASLRREDRVLSTYRGHGWALACGVPLDGLLGELLGRSGGINGGRGGSAYCSSPADGFVGENSIVGAGLPIANGVAMALAAEGRGAIAAVSFGDGATNQGASHEALVFAVARKLPVLFVCENNSWSEMTPIEATVPTRLYERAASYGLSSQCVDGSDVQASLAAADKAISAIRAGKGPHFLEFQVPRILGHYNADIEHYRSIADREEHASRDPIARLTTQLLEGGALSQEEMEALRADAVRMVETAEGLALEMPFPSPDTATRHVVGDTPSKTAPGGASAEVISLKYGMAVNRALELELEARDDLILFGEDIAIPGGTFGVTRNLRKRFGERVFDTPISEAAILGAAVGASIEGLRPVVEIMWSDFLFVAFDQVVNQAANVRYLAQGTRTAPLVIRMQQGITPGSCAQHSQSIESILAHIPGIKVGMPATAQDAFAMTRAAIADDDPVVLIEARELYLTSGPVDVGAPVETVGGARLRRRGKDLLIVTWGRMTNTVLEAAESLSDEGVEASVLDLRWINPVDEAAIMTALRDSGGRLLIVHEANLSCGFGAEVAARVAERYPGDLRPVLRRVALPDVRVPASHVLQTALLPSLLDVMRTARDLAVGRVHQ